ncbi:diacylglycerol acyltransferase [Globomyces pollinis-pini]|nr:diacylglycerol acyltransferase [Globomyces pollinis-pini]
MNLLLFLAIFGSFIVYVRCLFSSSWIVRSLAIAYGLWIFIDREASEHGRNVQGLTQHISKWFFWKYVRSYFDAELIKTAELDPKKSYIFACHPHGVYCFSYFINIFFNMKFYTMFPNIRLFQCTLPVNFYFPFWRDYILSIGTVSSSKKAIKNALKPGTAMAIFIGGAKEFKHMERNTLDLVLLQRKGFIKIAITTGSSVVPVLGFGENELYDQLKHPFFDWMHYLARIGKFACPLFIGNYGILPHRYPLITVVGKPLDIIQNDHPSDEEISRVHQEYMNSLQNLYNAHKDKYHLNRVREMKFIN